MSKQGASLIETMVAMVLLIIICLSSAYFFTIPPFRKEALRLASLERAAGMLDLVAYSPRYLPSVDVTEGYHKIYDYPLSGGNPIFSSSGEPSEIVNRMYFPDQPNFNRMSPIYYTLYTGATSTITPAISGAQEAELRLYDEPGNTNSLFATFKMILPPPP